MRIIDRKLGCGKLLLAARLMNNRLGRIFGIRGVGYREVLCRKCSSPRSVLLSKLKNSGEVVRKNHVFQTLILIIVCVNGEMEIRSLLLIIVKSLDFLPQKIV